MARVKKSATLKNPLISQYKFNPDTGEESLQAFADGIKFPFGQVGRLPHYSDSN
jgi:hypothetical protein